jgi:O-glycosyl hydrolase
MGEKDIEENGQWRIKTNEELITKYRVISHINCAPPIRVDAQQMYKVVQRTNKVYTAFQEEQN